MLFPLRDINPVQRTPFVTITLVALNVLVFVVQIAQGSNAEAFVATWGVIPYEITHGVDLVGHVAGYEVQHAPGPAFLPITLITSMFLHGGILHIVGNMLFLWIFGNNIEDLLGHVRFLVFYLVTGLIAAATHILVDPNSVVPTIGASGAVAGVLGAYLVAYPNAKVHTAVLLIIFIRMMVLPAKILLGFWFVIQVANGLVSLASPGLGGVAWFAHLGGFAAGWLGIRVIARPQLAALRGWSQVNP